jgi:putative NADH-flavin reductase
MRVAVFGASGRTGRQVVEQGLARGHEIVAFVRDRSKLGIEHEHLELVEGDGREPEAVGRALAGADAVVSVLALTSADREAEHSEATRVVLDATRANGVRRVVITANNDVLTDHELTGEYAAFGREHRRNRAAAEASGLDWTIGAAPWVTDDPSTGAYEAVVDAKAPGRRLAAADFATFVLDALHRDDWIRHVVGVSGPPSAPPGPSADG